MRCARCGRRGRTATRRGPDGRLVTDLCRRCLDDAGLEALGVRPRAVRMPEPEPTPESTRYDPTAVTEPVPPDRSRAMRALGLLLLVWGLVLELVAVAAQAGLGGQGDGLGPLPTSRSAIFATAGVFLAAIGLTVGLGSLPRGERGRVVARLVETAAVALGLAALTLGIAFHAPRRDPWIVAGVALAALIAWGARRVRRPESVARG